MRHKEVQELKTVQPAAMTCVSNKLCLKGRTGILQYKWNKLEQDMIVKGHSSVKKYRDEPFLNFLLQRGDKHSPIESKKPFNPPDGTLRTTRMSISEPSKPAETETTEAE